MIGVENSHCRRGSICGVRMKARAKTAAEGYQRYEGPVPAPDVYVHPESMFQILESLAKPEMG